MSTALDLAIERARRHVMTPLEAYEQRVSFIWGQLKPEDRQTRADIERFLAGEGIHRPAE